ncbi:MAG TPA: CRISPR-associated helicase Cas3' [Rhodanobacteraceae bacterium]
MFYAHSTSRTDKQDWQTLENHLSTVGRMAGKRAQWFGAETLASIAGTLHDLGKYTQAFQKRLEGEVPRVDHATWGAVIANQRYPQLGKLLAYAIAGHHAGLANGENGDARRSLRDRLGADNLSTLPPLVDDWQREIALPDGVGLPTCFKPDNQRGAFQLALLTRMVFSCLVDADFIDTDNFYRRIEGKQPRREGDGPSLVELRDRLNAHLTTLPTTGGINPLRADILAHTREGAAHAPGRFSLTVPTGGGKTLASLAFSLDHAIAHGLRRVIYVIPFTSIIEQNAAVFRAAFGDLGETAVLEHHSALVDTPASDPNAEPQSYEKRHLAMENWDRPIIVTTAVQFFESLFADRPSRCRKLHNIASSVVILDEAQTMPLHLLRPCVAALDELALNYRTSIVLCTATQPALLQEQGFKGGLCNVRELAPDPPVLYEKLRRVRVRHLGTLEDAALEDQLRQRQQVLCIVNNRRHARSLYQAIADELGALHLTTLMFAQHRSQVLAEVRRRLKAGEPCRLVSTSLIEAGVDVDFPTVLRAEAGLDSIAQAAGRCNREGRMARDDAEVLVFATANSDWKPPHELELFAEAFRTVQRQHQGDLLDLDAIGAYFRELYFRLDQGLDKNDLMGLLKGKRLDSLPFEDLANQFRVIESAMRPIIVSFDLATGGENTFVEKVLRELAFAPSEARKLQPFLVQVPPHVYRQLEQAGAIAPVAPERYGEQFVKLTNRRLYDAQYGLHWEQPQFRAEDMVC